MSGPRIRAVTKERMRRELALAGGSALSGPMESSSPSEPDSRLAAPAAAAAAGMVSDTLPAGPMADGEGYTPPNGGGAAESAPVVTARSIRSRPGKPKRPTPMDLAWRQVALDEKEGNMLPYVAETETEIRMEELSESSRRDVEELRRIKQLNQDGKDDEYLAALGEYLEKKKEEKKKKRKKGRKKSTGTRTSKKREAAPSSTGRKKAAPSDAANEDAIMDESEGEDDGDKKMPAMDTAADASSTYDDGLMTDQDDDDDDGDDNSVEHVPLAASAPAAAALAAVGNNYFFGSSEEDEGEDEDEGEAERELAYKRDASWSDAEDEDEEQQQNKKRRATTVDDIDGGSGGDDDDEEDIASASPLSLQDKVVLLLNRRSDRVGGPSTKSKEGLRGLLLAAVNPYEETSQFLSEPRCKELKSSWASLRADLPSKSRKKNKKKSRFEVLSKADIVDHIVDVGVRLVAEYDDSFDEPKVPLPKLNAGIKKVYELYKECITIVSAEEARARRDSESKTKRRRSSAGPGGDKAKGKSASTLAKFRSNAASYDFEAKRHHPSFVRSFVSMYS